MEGHWHHSTQQVSHHSGDNKQRRHHHFSHGECCVCRWSHALYKVSSGKLNKKMCKHIPRYPCTERNTGANLVLIFNKHNCCVNLKYQCFALCTCRRIWKWPSTLLVFSRPDTNSTNRTRSVQSESRGHQRGQLKAIIGHYIQYYLDLHFCL